jgi:hypothetical protein
LTVKNNTFLKLSQAERGGKMTILELGSRRDCWIAGGFILLVCPNQFR